MTKTMTAALAATAIMAGAVLIGAEPQSSVREASAAVPSLMTPVLASMHYSVASTGNAARYRVREQLMQHDLPNDAVGETQQVTGGIALDGNGAIVPAESRIVVQIGQLTSDQRRRDGYVHSRLLQADSFPTVEFVPTGYKGITPAAVKGATGPMSFDLIGNLTVHGTTHPTTWHVTAQRAGDHITGNAATRFTFADFGLTQPRMPFILSVADTIGLEYDFTLVRDGGAAK